MWLRGRTPGEEEFDAPHDITDSNIWWQTLHENKWLIQVQINVGDGLITYVDYVYTGELEYHDGDVKVYDTKERIARYKGRYSFEKGISKPLTEEQIQFALNLIKEIKIEELSRKDTQKSNH
jgi:hypothetical protein